MCVHLFHWHKHNSRETKNIFQATCGDWVLQRLFIFYKPITQRDPMIKHKSFNAVPSKNKTLECKTFASICLADTRDLACFPGSQLFREAPITTTAWLHSLVGSDQIRRCSISTGTDKHTQRSRIFFSASNLAINAGFWWNPSRKRESSS